MRISPVIIVTFITLCAPIAAGAQTFTPEVSFATGMGHVFRYNDESFGNPLTAGGAVALVHPSGFAIEMLVDRTAGLEPKPTPCGVVGVTCIGDGRYGPTSSTVTSVGVQYRLKGKRVRPYFTAALGMLWSRSLSSVTRVSGSVATITDSAEHDRGFGPDLGAGVRIALAKGLAISPEIRWLDAPWLARANLAVTRLSIRTSYGW